MTRNFPEAFRTPSYMSSKSWVQLRHLASSENLSVTKSEYKLRRWKAWLHSQHQNRYFIQS